MKGLVNKILFLLVCLFLASCSLDPEQVSLSGGSSLSSFESSLYSSSVQTLVDNGVSQSDAEEAVNDSSALVAGRSLSSFQVTVSQCPLAVGTTFLDRLLPKVEELVTDADDISAIQGELTNNVFSVQEDFKSLCSDDLVTEVKGDVYKKGFEKNVAALNRKGLTKADLNDKIASFQDRATKIRGGRIVVKKEVVAKAPEHLQEIKQDFPDVDEIVVGQKYNTKAAARLESLSSVAAEVKAAFDAIINSALSSILEEISSNPYWIFPYYSELSYSSVSNFGIPSRSGDVLVAHFYTNRVSRVNASGVITQQLGSEPGDSNLLLTAPGGIAEDSSRNVYVADSGNFKIKKYNALFEHIKTFGGKGEESAGKFSAMQGMSIGANGNLYIIGGNKKVLEYTLNGVYVRTHSLDDSHADPRGIGFLSNGSMYISDRTATNKLYKYDPNGNNTAFTLDTSVSAPTNFSLVVMDNKLYVPSGANDGVIAEVYDQDLTNLTGERVSYSDFTGIGTTSGRNFSYFKDSSGNHYFFPNYKMEIANSSGNGVFEAKPLTGDSVSPLRMTSHDSDFDVHNGEVFVADFYNDKIKVMNNFGKAGREFASNGSGNGNITRPTDVAIRTDTNEVYVADYGNKRIAVFDKDGTWKRNFGSQASDTNQPSGGDPKEGEFSYNSDSSYANDGPQRIAFQKNASGDVIRIFVVDSAFHRVQYFNASEVYEGSFGTHGTGDGEFQYPLAIAVDSSGNVFVSENGGGWQTPGDKLYRIQKFRPSGGGYVFDREIGRNVTDSTEDKNIGSSVFSMVAHGGYLYTAVNGRDILVFNSNTGAYETRANFVLSNSAYGIQNLTGLAIDGGKLYVLVGKYAHIKVMGLWPDDFRVLNTPASNLK